MSDSPDYAARLAAAMQARAVNTRDLSTALGLSYQAVRQVLIGASKAFSAPVHARAARHLHVDAYWLATGEGTMDVAASTDLTPDEMAVVMTYLQHRQRGTGGDAAVNRMRRHSDAAQHEFQPITKRRKIK